MNTPQTAEVCQHMHERITLFHNFRYTPPIFPDSALSEPVSLNKLIRTFRANL